MYCDSFATEKNIIGQNHKGNALMRQEVLLIKSAQRIEGMREGRRWGKNHSSVSRNYVISDQSEIEREQIEWESGETGRKEKIDTRGERKIKRGPTTTAGLWPLSRTPSREIGGSRGLLLDGSGSG